MQQFISAFPQKKDFAFQMQKQENVLRNLNEKS